MRPHQIFAAMTPAHTESFFAGLAEHSPEMYTQSVFAAAVNMKARPQYLLKQPKPKQAQAIRRALARVNASALAEEILAISFLQARLELLSEWLDLVGLEHEDGMLKEDTPAQPDPADVAKHVSALREKDDDPDRLLLLRAFAAQSAIDWPALDALVAADAG
jgi:hypothetical protein